MIQIYDISSIEPGGYKLGPKMGSSNVKSKRAVNWAVERIYDSSELA